MNNIDSIVKRLPNSPGIYLMKNAKGEIIYVGKAKDLKKRVSSYFSQKKQATKVEHLVTEIDDIEYLTAQNELEALVLETNYIKEKKPKYNILMRDDKHHQYIKVTLAEDYPRVYTVRKVLNDGALYFGPKTSSSEVKKTLKLLRKLFPYRTCKLEISDTSEGIKVDNKVIRYPCIYYHIKRCMGPCVKTMNPEYREMMYQVISFLKGDYKVVQRSLEEQMKTHAMQRRFEKAAQTRDLLSAISNMMERQHVDLADNTAHQDIVGIVSKFDNFFVVLLQIREGKLIGHESFTLSSKFKHQEESEVIYNFTLDYYSKATSFPNEVILPTPIEDRETLEELLHSRAKHKVYISSPQKGQKAKLVELAKRNALAFADQKKTAWMEDHSKTLGAAKDLGEALALSETPRRIECYDISHLGGTHTVGSMVVFIDGKPSKQHYRRFKIKTLEDGSIDDFQSMHEVLTRRLKKLKKQQEAEHDESFQDNPDLIIIDGGKGQLGKVVEVAETLEIDIPIVSLAKREEEVFIPGETHPLILPRESKALYLVQNIRDEAHRFAISFNRNLRSKSMVKSILDDIEGIGPKKKKLLLKTYGDTKGIEGASLEELTNLIGEKAALAIKEIL